MISHLKANHCVFNLYWTPLNGSGLRILVEARLCPFPETEGKETETFWVHSCLPDVSQDCTTST